MKKLFLEKDIILEAEKKATTGNRWKSGASVIVEKRIDDDMLFTLKVVTYASDKAIVRCFIKKGSEIFASIERKLSPIGEWTIDLGDKLYKIAIESREALRL